MLICTNPDWNIHLHFLYKPMYLITTYINYFISIHIQDVQLCSVVFELQNQRSSGYRQNALNALNATYSVSINHCSFSIKGVNIQNSLQSFLSGYCKDFTMIYWVSTLLQKCMDVYFLFQNYCTFDIFVLKSFIFHHKQSINNYIWSYLLRSESLLGSGLN